MRSIPLGMRLPQVGQPSRRFRPQSSGLMRRSLVKTRLRLSRTAGMGLGGTAVRSVADVFRLCVGYSLVGLRYVQKGLALTLAGTVRLGLWAGRPMVRGARQVHRGALAAAGAVYDFHLRHQMRAHSRMAPLLCMLACTCTVFAAGYFGLGLEVSLNGQSLGFVSSREEVSQIIREVEARAGEYLGAPCVLTPDISYNLRYLDDSNMLDADSLKSTLFTSVSAGSEGGQYVVKVDGQIIGGSASKITLQNMLGRVMKTQSFSDDDMKTEFVQDVRIEPIGSTVMELNGVAEMEALMTSNSVETQTYSIKSGDTISAVAKRHEMTVSQISAMNPNLKVDNISIGQEIMISAAVPYISLRQMRTEEYEEEIPFETIIEYSDSMYTNQSKVTKAGVPGLAAVVADVVYVNGEVVDRDVLERTVLQEPEAQVKLVGTQKPPPKSATGKFIKPSNGKFSSGYGYRKSLRDNHTGVDFSGKVGTAIWAADGGTVTYADWKGNYGYCVIIDHGNGYETLYAHCSSLLVKKGQKVAQGENIAKVGNTGRSTGPHVHFEVIVNGKHQNPLNYIKK